MIKKYNRQKGFTLVEMLIFMGILSLFLLVLSQIFTSLLDSFLETETTSNTDHDVRYVFERLSRDIGQADTIVVPSSAGNNSQVLQISINGATYTYASQSGKLVVTENGETSSLMGFDTSLQSVSFTRLGNTDGKPTVKVALQLKSLTESGPSDTVREFTTTFGTR